MSESRYFNIDNKNSTLRANAVIYVCIREQLDAKQHLLCYDSVGCYADVNSTAGHNRTTRLLNVYENERCGSKYIMWQGNVRNNKSTLMLTQGAVCDISTSQQEKIGR